MTMMLVAVIFSILNIHYCITANADRLQRRSDPSDFPMAQYKRQHDEFMHQQMAGQMARRSSFGQFYPEA